MKCYLIRMVSAIVLLTCAALQAGAAPSDWAEGTTRETDGATRDYYNRAARLPWNNFLGDWYDAENKPQGPTPFATARIADTDTPRPISWDVTQLVRDWLSGKYRNQGFFLRVVAGSGTVVFASREAEDATVRPRLLLQTKAGPVAIAPAADTYLDRSTYRSLGKRPELRVRADAANVLLRFELPEHLLPEQLRQATLVLFTTQQYGSAVVGVFRCQQGHDDPGAVPRYGIAAKYPGDHDIESDPAVIFAAGFESDDWAKQWSYVYDMKKLAVVADDPKLRFEPLAGKALRVWIAKGANSALNMAYKFKQKIGYEPEEIYFRYYLRFADDWNPTVSGGKLPGISGTYGIAGWGGRKVDGTNGWSARGAFGLAIPEDNPLGGLFPIGTYCYHADMRGTYGDTWYWINGYRGFLAKNRWYCIEQYLKLNRPDRNDGIMRAWVDGLLAFEKTDIRFRTVSRLKIEQIWMNVYHGGKAPSPYDQHLYIDNVVIATQYIGPMVPRR